jgi:hypothetical protein
MKFTLSWLKTFLDTKATIEELTKSLTMLGLEVEEIIDRKSELEKFEVAQILEVPIQQLFQGNVIQKKRMEFSPGMPVEVPYFDIQGHVVWGATAMIISELLSVLEK